MTNRLGKVYLVGAGPGDPGLITVRGLDALQRADVVLHDRLVSAELISQASPAAKLVDVGKAVGGQGATQEAINQRIVRYAAEGKTVVRLKGGDPFVFGRGGEEVRACASAGVECEVIPGVSSALAAPAAAGISVTQRGVAHSLAIVTAHQVGDAGVLHLDYNALASLDTLVVLMGRAKLREFTGGLLAGGCDPKTPAAAIASATTSQQRVIRVTLQSLAEAVEKADMEAPMVVIVGQVADVSSALGPITTV